MLGTLRRCLYPLTRILLTQSIITSGKEMSSSNSCSRAGGAYSCAGGPSNHMSTDADEKWRSQLTEDEYRVARERGTEPPFSGKYYKHDAKGVYTCVCCGTELFSSKAKYDSGSGWPSFFEALKSAESNGREATGVARKVDDTHGMRRVEILCKNCDAHLGHVFDDGPQPTGERFCVNSLSLKFKPKEQ